MTATMVACSDNDPEEPTTPPGQNPGKNPPAESSPITIVENPTYSSIGAYYGDYNDAGTGNYTVQLVTKNMIWDEDNSTYIGPGEIIYLEFNSTIPSNPNLGEIVPAFTPLLRKTIPSTLPPAVSPSTLLKAMKTGQQSHQARSV